MAAMSTTLTEFSTNGDSKTWTTSGHTAGMPKIVVQRRRVPVGNQTVCETTFSVIHAGVDANDVILPQKVIMSATVRYPVSVEAAAIAAVLVIFKDMVAGDEFAASVTSQNFLK